MKKMYEAPAIVDYGDVRRITAANGCGDTTDKDFPTGTKLSDMTCS